jgi:hypothetical protein
MSSWQTCIFLIRTRSYVWSFSPLPFFLSKLEFPSCTPKKIKTAVMRHAYAKEVHGSDFDQVTGYMTEAFLHKLSLLEDSFANKVFVTYESRAVPLNIRLEVSSRVI